MELLLTLRNTNLIEKLPGICDGVIVGGPFCSGYNYGPEDFNQINSFCKKNNIKFYVTIEDFISENEMSTLNNFFSFISQMNVDGIYFHDLGVYNIAENYGLKSKLIYDGQTVLCNSNEVAFYMSKGIDGVVLSSELTLEEIERIIRNNQNCCDLMIFGHQRLSYSKRKFLTNYFKQIDKNYNYFNSQTLSLIEEQRNYRMPIIEDNSGTKIYSDYVLVMYQEMARVKPYIKRGIINTLFIKDDYIIPVLRDMKRLTKDNAYFLIDNLYKNYPDNYSSGFLYQKTNITKDEQD